LGNSYCRIEMDCFHCHLERLAVYSDNIGCLSFGKHCLPRVVSDQKTLLKQCMMTSLDPKILYTIQIATCSRYRSSYHSTSSLTTRLISLLSAYIPTPTWTVPLDVRAPFCRSVLFDPNEHLLMLLAIVDFGSGADSAD